MSPTQPTATKAFALPSTITPVEAPAPLVVVREPPRPPRDSLAKKTGQALTALNATTHVEALKLWCGGVGAIAGYVLPAAALAGGARYLAQMNGADAGELFFATSAGVVAAIAQVAFQGDQGLRNIRLYKKEGYRFPRLMSFIDVTAFAVAPALAGVYFGGQHFGPWMANAIGVGAALAMSTIGLTHWVVRNKRTPLR